MNIHTCHLLLNQDQLDGEVSVLHVARVLPNITKTGDSMLMTQFVQLRGPTKVEESTRVLLDNGAQISLIARSLANRLALGRVPSQSHKLTGIGGIKGAPVKDWVELEIGEVGGPPLAIMRAFVVDSVCDPIIASLTPEMLQLLDDAGVHVDDCRTLEEARATPIGLLIGVDTLPAYLTRQSVGLSAGLIAQETLCGWAIYGVVSREMYEQASSRLVTVSLFRDEDDEECFDDDRQIDYSQWLAEVEKSLEFKDGRYWVGLPWLHNEPIDSNFLSALFRLRSLIKRLRRTGFYERYETEVMTLVNEGHVELIRFNADDVLYYMPHREVIREDKKTTKVRSQCSRLRKKIAQR